MKVAIVSHTLAMMASLSEPFIPPLPPSECYGPKTISSHISESLGSAAAEAVAVATRDLVDQPVKVTKVASFILMDSYPAYAGRALFDHTKPAKVPRAA